MQSNRRAVYWLLGLPFDLISLEDSIDLVAEAALTGKRVVFATPNLNFLRVANKDLQFRSQILSTDLSLVDGMTLVWLGRGLGIPFVDRVAGSTLFDRLMMKDFDRKIRVFFLGGQAGTAKSAAAIVNQSGVGLCAVGALNPGFGSASEISTPETIKCINESDADFLVISLGAVKGHEWIAINQRTLRIPVISHLGAVVNFIGGWVDRAPRWIQSTGFEWLWRAIQEPQLAARYAGDAVFLLKEFFTTILPLMITQTLLNLRGRNCLFVVESREQPGLISLNGCLTETNIDQLAVEIARCRDVDGCNIILDLSKVTDIDCRGVGYLYDLRYRRGVSVVIRGANSRLTRQIHWHRAESVFYPSSVRHVG